MMTQLHNIAHARAGDKGNTSNISVVAYTAEGWRQIRDKLTVELVQEAFSHITNGPITRYELPKLHALNFVIENALGGGVTRSLALDPHGKGFSSLMLTIELQSDPKPETAEGVWPDEAARTMSRGP